MCAPVPPPNGDVTKSHDWLLSDLGFWLYIGVSLLTAVGGVWVIFCH
jgi:hypothetical protein